MTRTRITAVALLWSLSLLPTAVVFGQQIGDIKVGAVNIARLLSESPQASAVLEALQDEFAPRQREIVAIQTELQERQAQVQRDLEVMGADERRNAERDLRNSERELQRRQNEYLEDLNLRRNEELSKLQRELLEEVQIFAQSSKFDLIVGEGVLYASEGIDVTDQILQLLARNFEDRQAGQ